MGPEIDLLTWIGLMLGSLVAGIVNTLAGGGSLLTVPLLVLAGLPATTANGTNRIGVLFQNLMSALRFRQEGFDGLGEARPILPAIILGALLGAAIASRMPAELFRQVFGVAMVLLLIPVLGGASTSAGSGQQDRSAPLRPSRTDQIIFFFIGVYGGAIQAGVGIFLIAALSRSGLDLVRANAIKVVLIGLLTLVAVPVFILSGQVNWPLASALIIGFGLGGHLGARAAVRGGEKLIRPVLGLAVFALAGHMLGLY